MGKGRRYDTEPKLNYKKVFAVIIAFVVLVMFVIVIKNLLTKGNESGKISSISYFSFYQDNKWGIIDSTGEIVIEPSYQEVLVVPNEKKDRFLCTYDINDETGEYYTKVLNSKNEEILTEFDQIEPLENYDKNNNIWYEQELLKVEKDGKYGLINFEGEQILVQEYESIETLKGIENSILVKKDGKYGLVNSKGETVLDIKYQKIEKLGEKYEEGYITVNEDGKYGIVDYTNKEILPNEYQAIEPIYGKDLFVIKEEDKQKVVNSEGIIVIENGFDEVKAILQESTPGIIFVKDEKYGVMDKEGNIVIESKYEELKEAGVNLYIVKENGKYGIIDQEKNKKIEPKYTNIAYYGQAGIYVAEDEEYKTYIIDNNFETKLEGILSEIDEEEGYLKIRIGEEDKYYNFKFQEKTAQDILATNTLFLDKKDGKYGMVDQKDNIIVEHQYDDAMEQNIYGYTAVKKDGKWGALGPNGEIIIEPTYNLDEYILVDFIGKWHLGQDINMNYYCNQ